MQNEKYTEEHLLDAFAALCEEEKFYGAYSLALDYHESVPLFAKALCDESNPGDMIGLFLLFCRQQDRSRAIKYATMLIDLYKHKGIPEKIIELSYHFTCNFVEPLANTSSQLIMKEGIKAVIEMLDCITDTVPSKEIIVFICANMLCFPAFCKDKEFSLPLICKLTSHYSSGHKARLYVIACFLPTIKRGLDALTERYLSFSGVTELRGIDQDELAKYIEDGRTYSDLIFVDGYPRFDGDNPFVIEQNRTKEHEYLDMIKEQELLKFAILSLDEQLPELPDELETRLIKLIEYYQTMDLADSNLELTRVIHLVSCFAMYRYVDMAYTLEALVVLAPKLLDYEIDDFTYTGTITHMQTVLLELSEVYELNGNDDARYAAYLKYLSLSNTYFKRTCFEDGFDYFMDAVKSDYSVHHSVVSKTIKVALDNEYSLNQVYFEMSQRKNLLYLGEMWQRQGVSAVEIKRILDRVFTFDDIQQAIGKNRTLMDFFYLRVDTGETASTTGFDRTFIDDIRHFACFVFVVRPDGDVRLDILDEGVPLAENIYGDGDSSDYFWNITEFIFRGIKTETVIVCADGDINQLNIAALPFIDGYITDHFAVRNIGSVMDIVYPAERKPIKSALLFNAPYYSETQDSRQGDKWDYLDGSEIEQEIIAETLATRFGIEAERIIGKTATKESLLSKVKSADGILHISTHGDAANGAVAVVTAGANISGTDALVSESEISSGHLENIPLAVFALCLGAKQLAALQDSLGGFVKASLLSGVNSIIAPIKPISDISTVVLLNEFYKFYLTAKSDGGAYSVEQALQQAVQRTRTITAKELLDEYSIELDTNNKYPFSEPEHWSPWVCFSREDDAL